MVIQPKYQTPGFFREKSSVVAFEDGSLQEGEQSIYILREAYKKLGKLGMLWSIGKDSTVLLWLAKKAFYGLFFHGRATIPPDRFERRTGDSARRNPAFFVQKHTPARRVVGQGLCIIWGAAKATENVRLHILCLTIEKFTLFRYNKNV